MKIKHIIGRTRSECRQQQYNCTEIKNTSYSTYMKFKPFSEECTMDHIEEKLQSFRNTMTYQRTNPRKQSEQTPLVVRLRSIINGPKKINKKHRRNVLTEMDIRSSDNSHETVKIEQKFKKLKSRSNSMSKISLLEKERKVQDNEIQQKPSIAPINHVRHDLSQEVIDEDNAFFDMVHKPKSSILLANFNKNNCFLFSRSKHKVFAIEQEKVRKPIEIQQKGSKFQSFGTYFYGSYMKKYMERRKLLGKKGTLIKMVAQ